MNRQRPTTDEHLPPVLPVLQARMGTRLAAALTEQASALPHDVSERLRVAREQALALAASRQAAAVSAPVAASRWRLVGWSAPGLLSLGGASGTPPWWQRALGVLPLVVLVSGLALIQHWSAHEQVMVAADIDAVLLADDLPPAAYSDPGFAEYLRSPNP